jgi:glutathione S-transferase
MRAPDDFPERPAMLQLFYAPGACSLASHIALKEAGLDFEAVRVQGRSPKMAGAVEYSQITEKNYVPALKLDDGSVLTEGTAILPYVADLKPQSALAPAAGTIARYRLHEWLGYINSEVHKGFAVFFTPGSTDEQKAAGREALGKKFEFVQKQLAGRESLLPGGFSVADAYLFTVLGWTRIVGIDLGAWPQLKAYHERIATRPAVQAAMKAEGLLK